MRAASATFDMKEKKPGAEKLKIRWNDLVDATTLAAFGDPVSGDTSVAVCIFDDAGVLVADIVVSRGSEQCRVSACWKSKPGKRYGYNDSRGEADGIRKIRYRVGEPGQGKILAKGGNLFRKRRLLPTGVVGKLNGNLHPTVQMLTRDGFCAGATMNEVLTDDGIRYTARLDP